MHPVAIEKRVSAIKWHPVDIKARNLWEWLAQVLYQPVRDVYSEPINSAIAPKSKCGERVD